MIKNFKPLVTNFKPLVTGHVLIKDHNTNEVLIDKMNAINFENFSQALALSIANRSTGFIQSMVFGNGAAVVSGIGSITYFPPNTTGQTATLYNQTYSKVVNDSSSLDTDPANNYLTVNHIVGNTYSDVVVTCLLDYAEPSGQANFDDSTTASGTYIFNELGLLSFDPVSGGRLLTHVIFHPVQKSLNRQIEIIYTLRIYLV